MFQTFLVLPLLVTAGAPSQPLPDPCPANSTAWVELSTVPDSLLVPPEFFFEQPTVPVDGLIVCPHGIFFNFHAMQGGVATEYYVSFPLPTHEELEHYVPEDTVLSARAASDPHYIDRYVDRQVAEFTERYNQLKADLRRELGERYGEGDRIDLAGSPAQLHLGFPLEFLWGEQSLPFDTYPGIYWRR